MKWSCSSYKLWPNQCIDRNGTATTTRNSMNYYPPPLNVSESSAVKKADSDNPGLETSEDPEIVFASKMRAFLSYVAATVTQKRLYNLLKGLDILGNLNHLIEPETKPLMDQEAVEALITKKPPTKR
ncbi:hypothetical protein AYI69_g8144 [Smittium culicis]|uniref:Uncharacterized protein n=1 Tax=Smittium culicis TaxID=133412 RepID=A0A1R1XLS1_9FUNG|nr:hypothetical protein AYI69_g8144 [Smittium culicis]